MEVSARLSSKGQITVPRSVRDALQLAEGDHVVFRVEGQRAILAKTADFLALAGSIPVPAAMRGAPWSEVVGAAKRARGTRQLRGS
ncbi:MAG TPA: AbrB/MazE/SpoVT family DNA-binding domain-containing protein [Candidatus Limnocylindrales bacterium]|nr:AbrB/MazE/SpoVT family DNA-binding domain-containing protein [Candidatus Limnocylindrales bacterium]